METKNGTGNECVCEDDYARQKRNWVRPSNARIMRTVDKRLKLMSGLALLAIGIMVLAPGNVSAATGQEKLNKTISNIQTFMVGIGIALAGVMLVLAGTKWMSTKGNPDEHSKVKAWIMDIGIGCVLVLSSSVLVEIAKGLIVQ